MKPWRSLSKLRDDELDFLSRRAANAVPGAFFMAGICHGGDVIEIHKSAPSRHLIIVDSFEGISAPGKEDVIGCSDPLTSGEFAAPFVQVMKSFSEHGLVSGFDIYKKWIDAETLKSIEMSPLAMVWIDLDVYAPTLATMRYCWQWLQPGGIMLTHDYGFDERCPGIKRAADMFGGEWQHMAGGIWGRINVREGLTDEAVS